MKFRKKPVVIEATQWFKMGDHPAVFYNHNSVPTIKTLEGEMFVRPGDWIITGVKGEHYPCKPDIFEATYELVEGCEMKEDVIRMAQEADLWLTSDERIAAVERFANLIRAAEREACAKVADLVAREIDDTNGIATYIAAALRARGQAKDEMPLFDDWPQFACPPCNHDCDQGRKCPHK